MKFKPIFTIDKEEQKVRLFRVIWDTGVVGDGKGYSSFVGVSLRPKVFLFTKDTNEWRFALLGVAIHKKRSYGGRYI